MSQNQDTARICIVGLGLIGGSLGMAIKAASPRGVEVIGYDREPAIEERARKAGAIDHGARDLADAIRPASLVILATPIQAMREVMSEIAPLLAPNTVVTDVASTKAPIMRWAQEFLPNEVSFVGGHPMAGKETQGIGNAEADLFRDRVYCLCPSPHAGEESVAVVQSLAKLIGARTLFIDPEEHDQYVAAISHLPLLTSVALFSMVRDSAGWAEIAPLASTGFRDATRLASGEPQMSYDITQTNREALLGWLDRYQAELHTLREAIAQGDPALLEKFARVKLHRDTFIEAPPSSRPDARVAAGSDPKLEDALVSFLAGRTAADRLARYQDERRQ